MVEPLTPEREVWGSILTQGAVCPSARHIYFPKVLVIPSKQWLRPYLTEKLFTGALSKNWTKQNGKYIRNSKDLTYAIRGSCWDCTLKWCTSSATLVSKFSPIWLIVADRTRGTLVMYSLKFASVTEELCILPCIAFWNWNKEKWIYEYCCEKAYFKICEKRRR